MADLSFLRLDFELDRALDEAPCSADKAAEALLILAKYLRRSANGERVDIPFNGARHLAHAIERAARVPAKSRPKQLARELFLTYPGRRPKHSYLTLAMAVHQLDGGVNYRIGAVAGKYRVDVKTVRAAWRKWRNELEAAVE